MGLGDILSKSMSYPFSDLTKFLMVGIGVILYDFDAILSEIFGYDSFIVIIGFIIAILCSFVMAGYSVNVTKKGIDKSNEIPDFDFKNNFIEGLKLFVVVVIYFLIPIIITSVLLFILGGTITGYDLAGALGIWTVFTTIIFIIFGIFGIIAQARFAVSRSIGDALSIGKVFADVKRIGIFKILLFLIVVSILIVVYIALLKAVIVVPVIGTVLIDILIGAFIFLFFNYGMGLLYSE